MIDDLVPLRFPEWTHGRTVRMHGAKYRHAASTTDLIICNSHFTARDVRASWASRPNDSASPILRRHPCSQRTANGPTLERPYALSVATLEPRKNLETLLDAHALLDGELALAAVGAAGWGPQPRLDGPGVIAARLCGRRRSSRGSIGAHRSLPIRPGTRASAFRYSRPWRAASRSSRPRTPSLDDACGDAALRADPESPEALARGSARPSHDGTSSWLGVSRTLRASRCAAWATPSWPRTRKRLRDSEACVSASTSRPFARRAPVPRATCARSCRISSGSSTSTPAVGRAGPRRDCRAGRVVVPGRACSSPSAPSPPAPLPGFRGPLSASVPARRHRARSRRAATPRGLQPLDSHVQPRLRAEGRTRGMARDRGIELHQARARMDVLAVPEEAHPRRAPTVSARRSLPRGPAPRANTCSPSGTVEPRKNLPRLAEAAGIPASTAPVAGAPGWGDVPR